METRSPQIAGNPARWPVLRDFANIRTLLWSSMARVTVGQFSNPVLLDQFGAYCELIRRRCPFHAEHRLARSDKTLRRPMALQAPFHKEIVLGQHQRHLVNSPVTCGTADAFVNMNAVIEVDKIGQVVNPGPTQRSEEKNVG